MQWSCLQAVGTTTWVIVNWMSPPGPIVFFGTPEFAVPTLQALCAAGMAPARVVTQPSRPVGRGRRVQAPPVARRAAELGLEVEQVAKVRSSSFIDRVVELGPWVSVVVAFGQIFPVRLLEAPVAGSVNLHASLLPAYRGAAPIQAAVASGEKITGVTTMRMTAGLDAGPILLQNEVEIGADETAAELSRRLAATGGDLIVATLEGLAAGSIRERAQNDSLSTFAPRLEKDDAEIDWSLGSGAIYDRFRAFQPWPGLRGRLRGEPIKIVACRPASPAVSPDSEAAEPGTVVVVSDAIGVACGGGTRLEITALQRPGRRPLDARTFANGERLEAGASFERVL